MENVIFVLFNTKVCKDIKKVRKIMQNYAKLYKIMQNYAKLCKIIQNYAKLCKITQNHVFLYFYLFCSLTFLVHRITFIYEIKELNQN